MSKTILTEEQILSLLRKLEAGWNKDYILFGGPHTLSLLRKGFGDPVLPEFVVEQFSIPADGGDPSWG